MRRWIAMIALAALGFLPGLTGCREMDRANARNTGDLLVAAGFRELPANTPERMSDLQTMKPRAIKRVTQDGRTRYVYSDPTYCQCVYMGNGEDYMEYQRLAFKQKVMEEKLEAAEAAENASLEQSYWGPRW